MENGNRRNLYLVTLSVSVAMMTLGVSSGWPTVVLPKFEDKNQTNVDIDKYQTTIMLTMIPVGFATGSFATGYIADKFGRRATILASALPITLGSLIIAFAVKAWQVCITSFLWNCGTGMVSTVINIYMTEVADKDVRGQLALITGFMFKFGTLFTMTAGPFLTYQTLNIVLFALPLLFFVTCWWIPETPYFCLKKNDPERARKSLRILRGYKDEKVLEDELLTLQENVKKQMVHSSTVKELFVGAQYRKAIVIATGLKLAQMMTGTVVIKQYLGWIIEETHLVMPKSLVFIIYGAITFVVSMCTSLVVDRVGRRPLLVYSFMGTGASLFIVGLYFFFQEVMSVSAATLTTIAWIPYTGIILTNVISTLGFSSLVFIIPAEIFPINVKAIAFTCLSLLGSALASVIALTYQRVKDLLGLTGIFWIFAAFAFGGSVFCYFFVIETKGKCLNVIQQELQGGVVTSVDPGAVNLMLTKPNDEAKESTEMQELEKKDTEKV